MKEIPKIVMEMAAWKALPFLLKNSKHDLTIKKLSLMKRIKLVVNTPKIINNGE